MSTLNVTFKEHHAVIELNRPKGHAINAAMVNELRELFVKLAESDSVQGVVLTSQGSIFSAGLDVVELFGYDADQMDQFWESFGRVLKDMVGFPKPLVCAINGHAPAGGCVFALCCDYRVMAEGNGRIGLNEIPVGVVIPPPIIEIARHVLGDSRASEMIFHGALLGPRDAGAFGVVHATVPADQLLEHAEAKLEEWIALPTEPWRRAKATLRAPLLDLMTVEFSEAYAPTLREWWSPESRSRVQAMIDRLQKK